MPVRIKKLSPVQLVGRPTQHEELYKRVRVLLDGNPYRFNAGIDYEENQQQEITECIRYLGRSHGMRVSVRTAKDRKSITAQFFKNSTP